MGQTISAWRDRVLGILRDSGADIDALQAVTLGVIPALAQFSVDRPRIVAEDVAGTGSAVVALPGGWSDGYSRIERIEYPAGEVPPSTVDAQSWTIGPDPDDPTATVLYFDRAATEVVRYVYTAPWPTPTTDATVDRLGPVQFEAVAHLAASMCCITLHAEASRSRAGALPTDFVDGDRRAPLLEAAAKHLRSVYDTFLGLDTSSADGSGGGSTTGPAHGHFDLDPQSSSLFHGGRR